MIKMTIGGEEVVCNKEFTIKEEMLSTSSTILNNCYPKSWEQDHDYTSRFYYPKDYSQCLIYEDEQYKPNLFNLETYFDNCFTRNCTKTLLDNGIKISFTPGTDCWLGDTLRSSDTPSAAVIARLPGESIQVEANTTYILSISSTPRCYVSYLDKDYKAINSAYIQIPSSYINTSFTFTTPSNCKYVVFRFGIRDNDYSEWTFSNIILEPQEPLIRDKLIFAGIVKNSGNISLNPREPKYCALEILDFKDFLSTGEYLDFVISNKTVLEAIQIVVDAVAQYGFVLGNVNILGGEEIIGAYSTQEKSAYDVFQYLADITGSRWTTRMIDENTVAIDFYDPTLMPQGIDIEYTQEWWEDNQVNDLKFSYGSRDYRNKQVMLSNQVYGGTDYSETILGDGYSKNFNTTENIGVVKSIYINGTQASVATNVDEELGIDADFYYTPGNNSFSSDDSQIYAAGTLIVITYTPLIKGREVIYNIDEVNRVNSQIGRKGVVARYEQRNDILYTEDLEKIGLSYIKYKGSAEVILTLTTQVDIYNVGEIVYFNAPIIDLAQNYMVKRKSTQIIATGEYSNVWYTYELTSSFNSETAINWFDNQRNKVSGNISEGEYITRNIDIENTANIIWDNLTITEVTPVGDNILNAPLNSPFIQ